MLEFIIEANGQTVAVDPSQVVSVTEMSVRRYTKTKSLTEVTPLSDTITVARVSLSNGETFLVNDPERGTNNSVKNQIAGAKKPR